MVDAEHRVRGEHLGNDIVELLCARQVVAERLLDNDAAPSPGRGLGKARVGELPADEGEEAGGHGEVERVIAARSAFLV